MMTTLDVCAPAATVVLNGRPSTGDTLRGFIRGMLAQMYPEGKILDRRRDRRFPFAHLLRLTPVAPDGLTITGEPMVVVGKHLSEGGLGFFHPHPIVARRVVATLSAPSGHEMDVLLDLTWCRFTKEGWYESGGRFLRVLDRNDLRPQTIAAAAG
ncbi:MAG: hypothetical protein WD030_00365 [Pirellulales bacterium]